MKHLKYIWRNIVRNKVRSLLTILSVSFCLALMTVLFGYLELQEVWPKAAEKNNRIVVMNIQGFAAELPIANVDRVRAMPGIKAATPYTWFGGKYKEERMPFAQFGTDAKTVFDVWDEFEISSEELQEWQRTKSGCVRARGHTGNRRLALEPFALEGAPER